MPFEKGNQLAKNKTNPREFADMIRIAVKEAVDDDKGGKTTKLRLLADALVNQALKGEVPALKEVADRLDGKVPQGIEGEIDHGVSDPLLKLLTTIATNGKRLGDDGDDKP